MNKCMTMPAVILLAGLAGGCGGSDRQAQLTELCQGEGMSESVCDCTARRFLDNVTDENASLTIDLINGVKEAAGDDPSADPVAAIQRSQASIQKVANDHDMSVFELQSRAQSAGDVYKQAQAACM